MNETNMSNRSVQIKLGTRQKFYCYSTGFPTPALTWYKDNDTITDTDRIKILNKNQELVIDLVAPEDKGIYKCEASNKYSKIHNSEILYISDKYDWVYAQLSLLLIAFIFICLLLLLKNYEEKNLERELRAVGLVYFQKGALESINPNLGIDEQAELLPYDRKWEIPLDQIELGKQLGSGAFGVIFQGKILNVNKTVVIKTTNPSSGLECIKFLVSELKIMAHLGGHVNLVNLLGACTRNIGKRGLYVLLEFCAFGNLRQYLQQHSQNFIDQKCHETDQFDWDKGKQLDVN